ncbi:MAG TPA: class I SAM-dependent methyltransferase [bacterium]|nr:class I SAM-dependent methyltransferase [bacterium]
MTRYSETPEHWIIVDRLADIILRNVEGCIVDIGIGASTTILAKHSVELNRRQYSCDQNGRNCRWAERELKTPIVYLGDSADFIKQLSDIPIAIALLDASHVAARVMKDIELILPKMNLFGVIFLHDTYPPMSKVTEDGSKCGHVYKARQELEQDKLLQVFTWPYTAFGFGLTMIMKKAINQPESRQ